MLEIFACNHCEGGFPLHEQYEVDGQLLCPDCANAITVLCHCCGDRILRINDCGDSSISLCETCRDDDYVTCRSCGRLLHEDNDAWYEEDDDDRDYPYCHSCYEKLDKHFIHEYSYKPQPIFYGTGPRFFGVELEIDDGVKCGAHAEKILNVANRLEDHLYIKGDSSLNDGLELVTHPLALDYHMEGFPWSDVLQTCLSLGYVSHKTSTCGLHIHVNRNSFSSDYEEQEECISRVLFFMEQNWPEILRFSRRTQKQLDNWASRYGYKENPAEILHEAKTSSRRYAAVNLLCSNTIEFRVFRGSLKLNTVLAALQLVDEICNAAILYSDNDLAKLSWCEFVQKIDRDAKPELITYLKERNLYVNDPVDVAEEL